MINPTVVRVGRPVLWGGREVFQEIEQHSDGNHRSIDRDSLGGMVADATLRAKKQHRDREIAEMAKPS